MARQRIDWKRLRQTMVALGRRIANFTVRGFRAAKHEASKDKYREYLSEAYGQMRERYPAVENTAKEALDAIGVRPRKQAGSKQSKSSADGPKKKRAAGKTKTTATKKKKTTSRKKAA
ncbi:MAG: hypothetical protein ACYTES_03880 [Planctomycetota bacterium]|jgi:hypothetical protein